MVLSSKQERRSNKLYPTDFEMRSKKIKVSAYAGFRGEESPRFFLLDERKVTVVEILDRWIEESLSDKTRKRVFVVKGDDAKVYKIYNVERTREWFIIKE